MFAAAGAAWAAKSGSTPRRELAQDSPQITALSNGGFVVTWTDHSQGVGGATGDSSYIAVKAQVFGAGGRRVGGEILVNTATAGAQEDPQITALSNGGFVVTWEDLGVEGDPHAIRAQVFTAAGAAVGSEILVDTATANNTHPPLVAALADDGFVGDVAGRKLGRRRGDGRYERRRDQGAGVWFERERRAGARRRQHDHGR